MAYSSPYPSSSSLLDPSPSPWQPLPSLFLPTPATHLAFDPTSPLLFVANPNGTVASHLCQPSTGLGQRYSSYRAHHGPVGDLSMVQSGILSCGGGGGGATPSANPLPVGPASHANIKLANRRGLTLWSIDTESQVPLTTYAFTPSKSSEIIATGPGSDLFVTNVARGSIIRQQRSPLPFLHLRRTSHLVGSTVNGSLALLDTRTPEIATGETVLAHTGGISQLEAEGNYIVTIGYTMRQGLPLPDPYLKLYDSRYLRPLSPIPFPTPPALVRFHPRLSSTVVVAAGDGRVQLLDLKDVSNSTVFQIETGSMLTSIAVAPTGEGLAFGDAEGLVHLWSSSRSPDDDAVAGEARFCRYEGDVEGPDPQDPPERIAWRDDTPLHSIGMPYYSTPLLSLLPPDVADPGAWTASRRPVALDPQIVATAKTVDFVGYATVPQHVRHHARRNQVRRVGDAAKSAGRVGVDAPMFRSERERAEAQRRRDRGAATTTTVGSVGDSPAAGGGGGGAAGEEDPDRDAIAKGKEQDKMPKYYRKVEIKYSRFGIEDFDFGFYNKTPYSGLETHITNSYTNSLLQALHYLAPIRTLAESHTYEACPKENCLLCEAGFLFRMLRDAKGMNCQASNFSRAFGENPQVTALGLIDLDNDSTKSVAYSTLIQTFNRYLLEQMTVESSLPPNVTLAPPTLVKDGGGPSSSTTTEPGKGGRTPPMMAQLVKVDLKTLSTCSSCGVKSERDTGANVIDLVYPRRAMSNEPTPSTSFTSILTSSLTRETIARLPCSHCRQNAHIRTRRALPDASPLPPVLVLNAGVRTADELELWMDKRAGGHAGGGSSGGERKRWVRSRFALGKGPNGEPIVSEVGKRNKVKGGVEYELRAMVVQIQAEGDAPHLVALARVSADEGKSEPSWHLFNDFLVRPISEEEALSFPGDWKIPAVLFYERVDSKKILDFSALPLKGDPSILCEDITISKNRDRSSIKHEPFKPEELPRRGTLVSIDAEFVSLQQEEAEFHSDGTKKVIRPSRMTLARVSVLRGEGPETGIPFIDDHIHTSEPVVDYLTEFSGIRAGDLDPFSSRHTLVPLKVAYKKLRMLVDLGCVFIGHGLNKDLRIINIYIPPSQIIDTVNIYHLASRQRKLSLRFLAYAVLHSAIQADTHDSIEDARTALQLYEEHNRLEAEGTWEDVLEEVYAQGKQTNFKVPTPDPPPATRHEPTFGVGALGPLPNQQAMFMRSVVPTPTGRRSFMG